ncbi:uncharacterized protein YdhG (YjbR/CyaY superfamily) [Microbacterium resistens]|uniref:Uncharacterized protein YdhG (YjbR/CyaY superfamily) n=1 Tax=Microbacterium resistens TaxID=156977 RepID=A0ABU1SEB9_9MICO|nr:hypothetical protein [Microbacterium resistens]MDR6867939.1 uncharacterized protein YdhG (YjbR/CyaY superfamily) [Microbacterium resistens]
MTKDSGNGLSAEERAAVKDAVTENRAARSRTKADPEAVRREGEAEVLAKIAEMTEADRVLAEAVHRLVSENAPHLLPRTYYGMPAYADGNGKIVLFFKPKAKFKVRYATVEFEWAAQLDDGDLWPTRYAVTALGDVDLAFLAERIRTAAPAQ